MARKKQEVVTNEKSQVKDKNKNKVKCPMCGDDKNKTDYYRGSSPLYINNNSTMVFCKDCVLKTYDTYFTILNDVKKSVFITCMKFDIPFIPNDFEGAMKELVNNPKSHAFRTYMTKINSLGSKNNDLVGFDPKFLFDSNGDSDLALESLEVEVKDIEYLTKLSEKDLIIKEDVTRMLGYDPFFGYANFDQKFLYNELHSYLDEDTIDDSYKLSQILQIVNNNSQVRKIDIVIANLSKDSSSLIANQSEIKSLTATKKSIVDNTDKIAKENSISVKNRGDKSAGKSTLTYLMKNYRELGFEDAEQDYYDQNIAYGMKLVADVSNKSIIEQLQFDENDLNDMLFTQRQLLQELQDKVMDLEEENRKLHVKLGAKDR